MTNTFPRRTPVDRSLLFVAFLAFLTLVLSMGLTGCGSNDAPGGTKPLSERGSSGTMLAATDADTFLENALELYPDDPGALSSPLGWPHMSIAPAEIERRTKVALNTISRVHGTQEDEFGATLFVSHHLEELEGAYWEEHLGKSSPDPADVLSLLVRSPYWEPEGDCVKTIDFTLPGEVTPYLLCVSFDEKGTVVGIEMES